MLLVQSSDYYISVALQNKDGRITKRDFRRVLESFCFRMSRQQFHELMAKIDPDKKGFVSYLDFLDRFEERETEVIFLLLFLLPSVLTLALESRRALN